MQGVVNVQYDVIGIGDLEEVRCPFSTFFFGRTVARGLFKGARISKIYSYLESLVNGFPLPPLLGHFDTSLSKCGGSVQFRPRVL